MSWQDNELRLRRFMLVSDKTFALYKGTDCCFRFSLDTLSGVCLLLNMTELYACTLVVHKSWPGWSKQSAVCAAGASRLEYIFLILRSSCSKQQGFGEIVIAIPFAPSETPVSLSSVRCTLPPSAGVTFLSPLLLECHCLLGNHMLIGLNHFI